MTTYPTLLPLLLRKSLAIVSLALAPLMLASAAQAQPPRPKLIRNGDVLSGELKMLKARAAKGKRVSMFQLESEPRRLPGPDGLCNLETGPETFQIVTYDDADVSRLKPYVGKTVSIKVGDVSCSTAVGQVSEAQVSTWSIVTR